MVIRISALPNEPSPAPVEFLAIDGASLRKTTLQAAVNAGAPIASQAEAEAGSDNSKRMTPLTVKQSISAEVGNTIASSAQGNIAETAVQPAEMAAAITAGLVTKFVPEVINQTAGAAAGYLPSSAALGYSLNTTGSTGFPSTTGETISFMFGGAGRAFDIFKAKGAESWYFRQLADDGSFGSYRRVLHDGLKATQAQAVAATDDTSFMTALKTGQEIDGRTTQIAGANSTARTIPSRLGDTVDLEEFLVGDGSTANDTQMGYLIAYMTANPQKVFRSRPGRIFKLSSGGWVFPDNISLNTEGAVFQLAANLSVGTAFIQTGANNRIDALIASVATGYTLSRGIFVSDSNTIGTLKIVSADQQANTGALTYGAIRLNGSDITVDEAIVEKFDYALRVYADGASGVRESISVKSLRVEDYVTGAYVRNISGVSLNDFIIKGRSPNALPNPGNNGLLLEGVEYGRFTSGTIRNSGEHGFRSGGFRDASTGTGTYIGTTRQISVDTLQVNGAGQTGMKIWSGSSAQVHKDISLNNIQCVDSGNDGDGLGFNDFGFMLQNIDGLNATGCTSSSRDNTYGAYDGWYLHGLSRSQMAGCRSYDAARRGMTIGEYSDGGTSGGLDALGINSLDISNFVSDQQVEAGIYLDFPGGSALRDLNITDAHIITCTNGIEVNAATGRFVQPCFISALVRGATVARFSAPSTTNLILEDLMPVVGSATYNPPSLADGAGVTTTVTATGAALGDLAVATFSLDLQGITLTAWISAANTVSVRFQNESGGVLDLGSGTLKVKVTKI